MAQPKPYKRSYSFTDFASGSPSSQPPGTKIDAELDAVAQTAAGTLSSLAKIQADDGRLAPRVVGVDHLSAPVLALIQSGAFKVRGDWAAGVAYAAGDIVASAGSAYLAVTAHTSTVLATDVAAGRFVLQNVPGDQGNPGNDGAKGDAGAAANTRLSLAEVRAADIADTTSVWEGRVYTWTLGDFTGRIDDFVYIKSDSQSQTVGAWVWPCVELTPTSLAAFKAANIGYATAAYAGSKWFWTVADYTGQADDVNVIKADSKALTVGAWVRQKADGIAFRQVGVSSVTRPADAKLQEIGITPQDKGLTGATSASQNAAATSAQMQTIADSATMSQASGDPVSWSTPSPRKAMRFPAGVYNLDGDDPLGGSSPPVPTSGLSISGDAMIGTVIRLVPAVPGKTLFRTSNWAFVRVQGLQFFSDNSANKGFDLSAPGTGLGTYKFEDTLVGGSWSYFIQLTGTANNDNYTFSDNTIYGAFSQAYFYVPDVGSSPQQVNFWWRNTRAYLPSGGWIKSYKGGSYHINCAELSGVASATPTVVFQLLEDGSNTDFIYNGQFNFTGTAIRAEFHNANAKMMTCLWPTGNVTWRNLDESSAYQAAGQPNREQTVISEYTLNRGGPTILYDGCFLTGRRKFNAPVNPAKHGYDITVRDTTYCLNSDPYLNDPLQVVPQAGETNVAALPFIKARGYRGAPVSAFHNIADFQNSHAYAVGDRIVSSDGYTYRCTSAGTSASSGGFYPSRASGAASGTAGFTILDSYSPGAHVENANIKADGNSIAKGCEVLTVNLCDDQGGFPARISSTQQNELAKIILPPNHRVLRISLVWPAGASPQTTTANWRVRNAQFTPVVLAAINVGNPSVAYSNSYDIDYDTGPIVGAGNDGYGKRIIVLEATTTVTDRVAGAQVRIEYQ